MTVTAVVSDAFRHSLVSPPKSRRQDRLLVLFNQSGEVVEASTSAAMSRCPDPFKSPASISPEILEARWRQLSVAHGVLDVLVPEIVLD